MRVHGSIKIARRPDVVQQTCYQKYRDILREDFGHICGYCGKSEAVTRKGFEIDHLVPEAIAPERKADYYNLVYSCFTCNRKKSVKWPTGDKDVLNDGNVGFVDPASEEFDLHLSRKDDGSIEGKTSVGNYMCKEVFKFHLRPMKELWLCSEILIRQEILENKIAAMSPQQNKEYKEYVDINRKLKELCQMLFEKNE